jgi:hypothetical protein
MRIFDRAIDGVGTRIAISPRTARLKFGNEYSQLLLGTVSRLDDDKVSLVNFDTEMDSYVNERRWIVFDSGEDAEKFRPFDSQKDGVGSRVAVIGFEMPAGNDEKKIYYGTIKRLIARSQDNSFWVGIEFDNPIVAGNNLDGLADNDSGLDVESRDVIILDGPIASKGSKIAVLEMMTDVILSTTSKTNFNRAEVVKSLIKDKVTEDEVRQSFDSQEAYDLFMDILQDLEKDEAKRLGTTVSTTTTTPTPRAMAKRGRKKKEPVLAQPVEIITPDISDFTDEDELSSLLDEFLT